MTVKKLVKSTHPILKKEIKTVNQYDDQLKSLLQDLEDTLYAEEAAAISAPQIGVNQREIGRASCRERVYAPV